MCLRTNRIIAAMLCMLTVVARPQGIAADDALANRFLQEAPRKWKEYRSILRGFDLRSDEVIEVISGKTEERVTDHIVCGLDDTRALLGEERTNRDESLYGSNPGYSFELRKPRTAQGAFSIHDVASGSPSSLDVNIALKSVARQKGLISRAFPLDFSKMISSPDFQIKDAADVVRPGKRCVQIEFEFNWRNPGPKEKFLAGSYAGTAVFVPDTYWGLIDAKFKLDGEFHAEVGAIEVENMIENAFRDVPAIIESRIRWYDRAGKLWKRSTVKNEWKELAASEEKMFTLSGYGFPEPGSLRPSRARLWFFCANAIVLALGIVFFLYRRRKNASNAL